MWDVSVNIIKDLKSNHSLGHFVLLFSKTAGQLDAMDRNMKSPKMSFGDLIGRLPLLLCRNYLPNQAPLFGQVHSLLDNAPNYLVGRVIHKRMEGNADVMKVSSHHLLNAVCQKNQRGKIATRFKKRIKQKKHFCKFHHIINHSCYVCCDWIASSRSRD